MTGRGANTDAANRLGCDERAFQIKLVDQIVRPHETFKLGFGWTRAA
jgi:hypothetical protein